MAADKLVWQILLEDGTKRDEATLESYRVSFTLLPLLAKKENQGAGPKPKPAATGGKGANNPVSKPWLKAKGGKKGGKSKQRVPPHIYKLGGTATKLWV